MEIRYLSSPLEVKGFSVVTNNEAEFSQNGKIPGLWQRFDNTIAVDYKGGERVYGVYFNYEDDHTGNFSVLAGFDGNNVPENINAENITIPSGKYLVFTRQGEMPQIAIDAWSDVWRYFTQGSADYERTFTVDFEHYVNGSHIDVYIAVK
ncbi:effector binding domain-containing protein [Alteromonas sp. ALT199]|uniref:GyrI-like domain-containing protein n=1 Tax=unclassified Alteromonas TaxID=2614992 RepID=UPI000449D269|nr:effector binding domain-containing protein [Alteromonas sp. ALT199]MBT3134152.1 effector binding domain-containing protein [Alteromonas sp. ALT199]